MTWVVHNGAMTHNVQLFAIQNTNTWMARMHNVGSI